ncbi:hypothetical protein [Clostridium sp. ZBS4]|uniref:hypothetical protein n=1 Tax=Clostridium sp. ZBS4 TaxID=2949974 RepID=UPI002079499C|nr:hypothetical protein [Clostridium sp. ZBS4]
MSITSNPADRLYEILNDAKRNCDSNNFIKSVWASTFDIDRNDEEKIFLSVVKVIEQIETVKKVADKMQSSIKVEFIKEITELEREIMNLKLDEQSISLKRAISEKRLMSLKAIIMGLDICNQYSNIEEETIFEFREKILQLISEINDLSINDDLKNVVIDNLNQVDLMIDNYKLYGIDGIKSAVENGVGSIILNKELSEETSRNVKLKETLITVLNLLGNINTVVTFTKNVVPIVIEASDIAKKLFLN